MTRPRSDDIVALDVEHPVWDRFFTVAPLVVIGTREPDGHDLTQKHMATPLGWSNYFGFVCTEAHATYRNAVREGAFSVSFLEVGAAVVSSLAAGRIVAARVDRGALRLSEGDDQALLRRSPLLAYLAPGRYAEIRDSQAFPFPAGFRR